MLELTSGQHELLDKIMIWFNNWQHHTASGIHPQWFSYSGPAGSGKAQPDDTLIPTPTGIRQLKDLSVGDSVFNHRGKATKIFGIYPQGVKDTYEITFSDGRKTKCCGDHIWRIKISDDITLDLPLRDIIPEYRKSVIYIQMNQCVQYQAQSIEKLDPYVLGFLLGYLQSSLSCFTVSTRDYRLLSTLCEILDCKEIPIFNNTYQFYSMKLERKIFIADLPEIISGLIGVDISNNHIPAQYLFNTEKVRRDLLRGLSESLKRVTEDGAIRIICIRSREMLADIVYLIRSLGIYVDTRGMIDSTDLLFYKLYLFYTRESNLLPFELTEACAESSVVNSIHLWNPMRYHFNDYITIVNIQYCGECSQRCIYIDDPAHLYLTNDFIVTHNTTVVKEFLQALGIHKSSYTACAYTGNAVLQLQKHNLRAQTIHSLIYNVVTLETAGKKVPTFELKQHLDPNLQLLVVDEATMVNDDICKDLLSFDLPIIFIGDKNQLPPVFGESSVMNKPNYILTQIMRQQENDPIIQLSQMVLHDIPLFDGKYGESEVIRSYIPNENILKDYDQVIAVTNEMRFYINSFVRSEVFRLKDNAPVLYDRVICRKNNWNMVCAGYPLTNGTSGRITEINSRHRKSGAYLISFRPDYFDGILPDEIQFDNLEIDAKYLCAMGTEERPSYYAKQELFEYCYAITVYLSQGAEWNRVLYIDRYFRDWDTTRKSRYTAITRAKEKIVIVKDMSMPNSLKKLKYKKSSY